MNYHIHTDAIKQNLIPQEDFICNSQELFLCSKNLNIDTPIFCDYNLIEKYVEIYNFGD